MELRKLRVKLCIEDQLSAGDISTTVGKSKSVIHCILRKLEETGLCKVKEPPSRPRKILQGKTNGLVMDKKRVDFQQQPLSLKELMLTLTLIYHDTLFS